jgi:hypothetical protein
MRRRKGVVGAFIVVAIGAALSAVFCWRQMMGQPAQTVQKANGNIAPVLKLLLIVAALIAIGFSMIVIDLPNKNYLWIVAEIVVAVLLILAAVSNLRRVFGGKR